MDRSNDRQQVRSALEEGDEMVRKQNADRRDLELDIKLQRVDAEINRRGERKEYDRYLSLQRVELDKAVETSHSELAKKVRTELLALLNKALTHQRATYDQKIEQERALSNDALHKAREENDANIKNERKHFQSMIEQAKAQLATLDEERLKMKTLIESFIEREEARATNELTTEEDMIHIPRRHIGVITDNECDPHVQMRFKIHSVKEIYSDLQMYYDSREDLAEFTLRKPATVQYYALFQQLYAYFIFKGDAQLYYLNPAPGINPATALVKIDGQEDIDKMVDAHAHKRTKICHLYIVNGLGFYDENGYHWIPEEGFYLPYEQDPVSGSVAEEDELDDTSPEMKKQRADE